MRFISTLFFALIFVFNVQSQILDVDFGDNGISILDKYDLPGFQLIAVSDANGDLFIAGIPSQSFMNNEIFVTKIDDLGSVDLDFGLDGYATYDLGEGFVSISDFIQLDNGNLVVSGTSFQDGWLIMFDNDGNLVTDFGSNGFFDTQISADVNRVLITQANDKIFALHKGRIGGSAHLATSYYNLDGTYDTTYGTNGTIIYEALQFNALDEVAWEYNADGEFNGVYFLGYSPNGENVSFLSHVSASGELSNSFGDNGLYRLSEFNFLYDIALDFDRNIVLTGREGDDYKIQKLDGDGTLITDFGTDGSVVGNWSSPLYSVAQIIPVADRGFLHFGSMGDFQSLSNVFQKHNADGSVDETIGEVVYNELAITPLEIIHLDNGDIFIFGFAISEDSVPDRIFVLKYKSDITEVLDISSNFVEVFPNPTDRLSWTIHGDNIVSLRSARLLDITGRYIVELEVDQDQIYSDKLLNNGTYILSAISSNGESINTKVTIAR